MLLRGAAALFAGQYVIQDQVDAIFAALVMHRVQSPVVDFIQLPFAHVDRLIANGKPNMFIRNDRQMDAMRMRERKIHVAVLGNAATRRESYQRCTNEIAETVFPDEFLAGLGQLEMIRDHRQGRP